MPLILKALLVLVKTRRGRRLLFAAGLAAAEALQGEQARKLYARARGVNDRVDKQKVIDGARRVAQRIRP